MIKKCLVLVINFIFISGLFPAFAQIGINTENISSGIVLYIDPARDNATSGTPTPAQTAEDIVINQIGNMGIGTVNPQAKLHIVTGGTSASPNPQFRLEDGRQSAARVLTSSSDGYGRWMDYAPGAVLGSLDPTGVNIALPTGSVYQNTKSKISLSPGRWVIMFTYVVTCNKIGAAVGSRLWVSSTIGDDSTLNGARTMGTSSPDIEGVSIFNGLVWLDRSGIVAGRCIVNNTSQQTKDYYYLVGNVTNYQGYTGVVLTNVGAFTDNNSMFAFRVTYN